jgi:hypothetical protein
MRHGMSRQCRNPCLICSRGTTVCPHVVAWVMTRCRDATTFVTRHQKRKKNVQRGLLTMHGHVSYLGAAISTPPR